MWFMIDALGHVTVIDHVNMCLTTFCSGSWRYGATMFNLAMFCERFAPFIDAI